VDAEEYNELIKEQEIVLEVLDKYLTESSVCFYFDEAEIDTDAFNQIKDKLEQLCGEPVDDYVVYGISCIRLINYADTTSELYHNKPDVCNVLGIKPLYYKYFTTLNELDEFSELDDYDETIFSYNKELIQSYYNNHKQELKNDYEYTDEQIGKILFTNIK
jgi:hypothetical protein